MRLRVPLLLLLLLLGASFAGCARPAPPSASSGPQPPAPAPALARFGLALSPRSSAAADFRAFFDDARAAGGLVEWAGDWDEMGKADGAPAVLAQLAKEDRLTPVYAATFFRQQDGALLRPLDAAQKERYQNEAVAFVKAHDVPYLALGIEVDTLRDRNPDAFETFAAWFPDLVRAVKEASPRTLVFPTFQYERLIGEKWGVVLT